MSEIKGMETETFRELYGSAVKQALLWTEQEGRWLEKQCGREIVSSMSGRVKTAESARRKLLHKGYTCDLETAVSRLNDLAGIRVICFFMDDVYALANRLKENPDFHFIKEKNYILRPKSSGYKSLHLIVELPVNHRGMEQWVRVEIQLRTLAMDFWARLDHRLCYKKELKAARAVQKDLREYAEIIAKVDEQMLKLRSRIDAL